jgi:sigma-54 dependent transcriptional regulator, flagellar regulatory protein
MQHVAFTRNVEETTNATPANPIPLTRVVRDSKYRDIIGQSEAMQQVFRLIDRVADSDSTVVVYGESGTGKELVARAIHHHSSRRSLPFVAINCGAIPENLLESELFGHVRGSFTGATANKMGKFELAQGGTIFLDEIGDMSPELQVKLLRVLERKEFEQVGANKTIKVDVRIVAATHRDLEQAVEDGKFREDLFYRLQVIPITLPPLRMRKADIPLLVAHFLEEFNRDKKQNLAGISEEALRIMVHYPWRGNVRELKNLVERLVILKGEGTITPWDLPEKLGRNSTDDAGPRVTLGEEGICLNTAVSEFEKALILQSLERTKWVKNKAAKLLQLNRTTLVEKIKKHRIQELVPSDVKDVTLDS